jgi:hypothetical protein
LSPSGLRAGESAIPVIEPVALKTVLLTAVLNPVVVLVALWMGSSASQLQKVPVAAFAAALAGWLLLYAAMRFGWGPAIDVRRASAGVVVAQFLVGLVWAGIGYWWARREL